MTMSMRWLAIGLVGVLCSFGRLAAAQEGGPAPDSGDPVSGGAVDDGFGVEPPPAYPVSFTQRPLTLPALTLRGDLGFQAIHFDLGPGIDDFSTYLGAGVGFGILDDLEVGVGGSPVAPTLLGVYGSSGLRGLGGVLSPEPARGFIQPEIYGRYRFLATDVVEVGAEVGLTLPTGDTDLGLALAVPARLRFGESFALDLALVFLTSFGEDLMGDRDPFFTLSLNVAPRYAMEMFYVGIDTGFTMSLNDPELTFIPFGLEAGATFGVGPSVVIDVFAQGGLPFLLAPGSDDDKALTEIWVIGLGARVHIGFAS